MGNLSKKAITVLSGGLNRGGKFGWQSSAFNEPADVSVPGSYVRMAAAACLWHRGQSAVVVTLGGRGEANEVLPPGLSFSTIMREELKELGVPESMILEENQSGTTHQQLVAIARLSIEKNWSEIYLVSNRYHLPRVRAMVEHLESLSHLRSVTTYVSAEETILEVEPEKWRGQIEAAYDSTEFARLIEAERRGVTQVVNGTYKYR